MAVARTTQYNSLCRILHLTPEVATASVCLIHTSTTSTKGTTTKKTGTGTGTTGSLAFLF